MPRSLVVLPFEKIELPRIVLPTPASAKRTPSRVLKAIVLASPAFVPPIVLKTVLPPVRLMPLPPFGRALVPSALVPMKLPWIRSLLLFTSRMPSAPLPEIRLTRAGVDPPMVLLLPGRETPLPVLLRPRVPLTSVPMKSPVTFVTPLPGRPRP